MTAAKARARAARPEKLDLVRGDPVNYIFTEST
jgi:hypothetical protein